MDGVWLEAPVDADQPFFLHAPHGLGWTGNSVLPCEPLEWQYRTDCHPRCLIIRVLHGGLIDERLLFGKIVLL